jgi:TPR repeat protein
MVSRTSAQNNADAQYFLGLKYYEGVGIPKDHEVAVKWFRLTADQGDARAQTILGAMCKRGDGLVLSVFNRLVRIHT